MVEFHSEVLFAPMCSDIDQAWIVEIHFCPVCEKNNLFLVNSEGESIEHMPISEKSRAAIHPRNPNLPPSCKDVPIMIIRDYEEACLVLPYSPRASAALSRKALLLLQDVEGDCSSANLVDEIEAILHSGQLPEHLAELLEAVPKIGAFDEQPEKGQFAEWILPVKTAEAELNLDVLERLFEFYYVQPALTKSRKAALNSKLISAGEIPLAE
jgi:hypothetical protein